MRVCVFMVSAERDESISGESHGVPFLDVSEVYARFAVLAKDNAGGDTIPPAKRLGFAVKYSGTGSLPTLSNGRIALANKQLLRAILKGPEHWNPRRKQLTETLDLSNADLRDAELSGADLSGADLRDAVLIGAQLKSANLSGALLIGTFFRKANLSEANLSRAILCGADFRNAEIPDANLADTDLRGVLFLFTKLSRSIVRRARFGWTIMGGANLDGAVGLDECAHDGPSIIDFDTVRSSWPLPDIFLRGCGLRNDHIELLRSLVAKPSEFSSCFISHSSKDAEFAKRLYDDLQRKGVRCWFAPHDLKIGAKTPDAISDAIRAREKLLLILSENSIESGWVEAEVRSAFAEEERRSTTVLFPVRLDDSVFNCPYEWAARVRHERNVGDFRGWEDNEKYGKALQRVLLDLRPDMAQKN